MIGFRTENRRRGPSMAQVRGWARELERQVARVGVPNSADQPKRYYSDDGAEHEDAELTLVEVATFNEFGTRDGRVPARPFMAISAESGKRVLKVLTAKLWVSVIRGENRAGEIVEDLLPSRSEREQATARSRLAVARKSIEGYRHAAEILEVLGLKHASQIQETIAEGVDPPNAPRTIYEKGSSRTLISTGQLRQSITYVVEDAP